ncbi:MAG: D-alanyl-lipoteichoic acid biosynthesis protein DltD [Streptococcaceae bacterium]|jgi:D-alanine transfer protein|nr:D-alanyl-lipoteichoic acid biosynthesis protein DltD [Streptococcaceae bacterium]
MTKRAAFIKAVGPLIVAFLIVGVILFSPLNRPKHFNKQDIDDFAISQSNQIFIGQSIKRTAFENPNLLPIFGSSELSRFDSFHPSILAEKYKRSYTPFLIGTRGTQSLVHYFYLNAISQQMKGRKAVFIISPQWFVKDGILPQAFATYTSPEALYSWAEQNSSAKEDTQAIAKRLLSFDSVTNDYALNDIFQLMSVGEKPAILNMAYGDFQENLFRAEDNLFSRFTRGRQRVDIEKKMKLLPEKYDVNKLDEIAEQTAKKRTSNNDFMIINKFYDHRIKKKIKTFADSQKDWSYLQSVEYSDFQILLNQLAELKMDVLFVIPPVNGTWTEYTGLNPEMLDQFSVKIKRQLQTQGFNQIADFTDKRDEPYFMEDTIHIGYRGWVAFDQALQAFMAKKHQTNYQIDNASYLSDEWDNQIP